MVLGLFAAAFVAYLFSIHLAKNLNDSTKLTLVIVGFSILFRGLMLVSTPIQEVDIYRYIWDGVVVSEGISPFRYPPDQVKFTPLENTQDPELKTLIQRYRAGQGDGHALHLIHYGQVPTVYPPVSQAVFAMAAICSDRQASLLTRRRTMKGILLLFDIGTIVVLISLLKLLKMPTGWSVAYAWCPLVLKEIGNSGHLDSIAIFLTTAAVWLFVRNILVGVQDSPANRDLNLTMGVLTPARVSLLKRILPVVMLALAIGAKLYAMVLAPLFCFVAIKRLGWRATLAPALIFIATTTLTMWPMLPTGLAFKSTGQNEVENAPQVQPSVDPSSGMAIFLKYWQMNDFIFMNTVENLKPASLESRKDPWFTFAPEQFREELSVFVQRYFETDPNITPFLTARFMLAFLFFGIAISVAAWAVRRNTAEDFCRAAFLTIAWFWLLSPTQNPWYWLWAMPLLPFAKNRTWYLMSGILFVYYTRFWFEYHFTGQSVLGSLPIDLPQWADQFAKYQGVDFFDFFITWLEHAPWLALLILETTIGFFQPGKSENRQV